MKIWDRFCKETYDHQELYEIYIDRCLLSGTSQRLNGKVSGVLNNVEFSNLDMHSFVVTKDGRAYTAISRVPVEIGPHMMTLNTIGGIIGWLFALPISRGALNGYSFTGNSLHISAFVQSV